MRKRLTLTAVLALAWLAACLDQPSRVPQQTDASAAIERAYAQRDSDIQVEGSGVVIRLLADDHSGSRHQRFIVRLDSGLTLLLSHNVDIAPRIDTLRAGDAVAFRGEYQWNDRGGVVHWTHDDPDGRHPGGWVEHGGRIYR